MFIYMDVFINVYMYILAYVYVKLDMLKDT